MGGKSAAEAAQEHLRHDNGPAVTLLLLLAHARCMGPDPPSTLVPTLELVVAEWRRR